MTRPIIALSQRRDHVGPPHNETRDALDERFAAFILQCGAWPVPVPSAIDPQDVAGWCENLGVTGIVISGGGDPGLDPVRDSIEIALMNYAQDHDQPLLGVCRGMQMLGFVESIGCGALSGHVATRHAVSGIITRDVNSYHNLALASCPTAYTPLAKTKDGALEAMRHRTLSWEGWMWHPEREVPFDPQDINRFRKLFLCAHLS